VAKHWNTDHLVAPFPHEPAQPVTFSPNYDGCWKGEIPFIVGHFCAGVESYGPNAGSFELLERPGDVHDVGDGHVIDGACRGLRGSTFKGRCPAGLADDPRPAGGIDASQDCTHILRILDLVEHDDQRRAVRGVRQILERGFGAPLDLGDNALVNAALRIVIELLARHEPHAHAAARRLFKKLLQAIVGPLRHADLLHPSGLDRLEHGVDAVDDHRPTGYQAIGPSGHVLEWRVMRTVLMLTVALVATLSAQAPYAPARYARGAAPVLPALTVGPGQAFLELTIRPNGTVEAIRPLRSTPPFTEALSDAVNGWQFTPALEDVVGPDGKQEGPKNVASKVLVAGLFRAPTLLTPTLGEQPADVGAASEDVAYPTVTIEPPYPPQALSPGLVIVEASTDPSGRVLAARVVGSSPAFNQAALDAARKWRFKPARIKGHQMSTYVYLVFGFPQPVTGH